MKSVMMTVENQWIRNNWESTPCMACAVECKHAHTHFPSRPGKHTFEMRTINISRMKIVVAIYKKKI